MTDLGKWTFYNNTNLTDVTIGNGVTNLDNYLFYRCNKLDNVTVPESVKKVGQYTFGGCTSMSNIQLPDSLESIDKCAFVDCDSLTNITIPKNVSSIGSNAFGYKVEKDTFVKGNDMTITGNESTAAKDYANANDITFDSLDPITTTNTTVPVATDTTKTTEGSNSGTTETVPVGVVLYGDVNLDGRVDVTDCVLLNKAVAGSVQLDTAANKNADCNGNGEISSDDATVLMQFIVNLVKTLPYNG